MVSCGQYCPVPPISPALLSKHLSQLNEAVAANKPWSSSASGERRQVSRRNCHFRRLRPDAFTALCIGFGWGMMRSAY